MSGSTYLEFSHLRCYVCLHVMSLERPVLYVCRDEGDWMFLCGGTDHLDEPDQFPAVGMVHVVDTDASLVEVLDLGPDQAAERSTLGGAWRRTHS